MTTTDINGLVYYETTDNVTPLQVVLNGISTAVTNAFDSTDRIFRVANATARDALYASRGGPLTVARTDTGMWERRTGATWRVITPVIQTGSSVVTTDVNALATVTFPVAYTLAPQVVVMSGDASTSPWMFAMNAITTTTFMVAIRDFNGTPYTNLGARIDWIAVGT